MEKKYKLGFLGLGKMGSSILQGILNKNLYKEEEIFVYDHNQEKIDNIINKYSYINVANDELELLENVEKVILAIKPQSFDSFLAKFENERIDLTVISIAAGIKTDYLRKYLGENKYIRVMPNTPAMLSSGAIAISKSNEVDDNTFKEVKQIFESVGVVEEIKENQMDKIVPLNGSMPAYLYLFAKSFIEKGISEGIDKDTCINLVVSSIIGSAKMILESNKEIDELISDVCSKGGTTLAGLDELKNNNFIDAINKCYDACYKRSVELGNK